MELSEIIGQIESGGNRMAERYEERVFDAPVSPAGQAIVDKIALYNNVGPVQAKTIYSTSLGLFQIMGMTLYGMGYEKPLAFFQCSIEDQIAMFDKFVEQHHIDYTVDELRSDLTKREEFALHYNGPGNVNGYAHRIAAEIARRDTIVS